MAANDRAGFESLESTSRLRNLLISSRGMNCGINNIIDNIYIYTTYIHTTCLLTIDIKFGLIPWSS